jgi:hypothetical protein
MRIAVLPIVLLALTVAPPVAGASPEPPPPGTPPTLTGLAMTERTILSPSAPNDTSSKLPRQTTFSFFLNQSATFRIVFKQVRKGGGLVKRGALIRDGVTGKNRVHFAGKLPKPKGGVQFLSAGRYKVFFNASNGLGTSPVASIGFRVVRPKT